jgi:uncharacterized protein YbaR (Trm112 family)
VQRVFWTTCPDCQHKLMVDYGIRFVDVKLECPNCRRKYTVDEAAGLDERWG